MRTLWAGQHLYGAFGNLGFHRALLLKRPLRGSCRSIDTVGVLVGHLGETLFWPAGKVAANSDQCSGQVDPWKFLLALLDSTGASASLCKVKC